jgi:hypothetical protein
MDDEAAHPPMRELPKPLFLNPPPVLLVPPGLTARTSSSVKYGACSGAGEGV